VSGLSARISRGQVITGIWDLPEWSAVVDGEEWMEWSGWILYWTNGGVVVKVELGLC